MRQQQRWSRLLEMLAETGQLGIEDTAAALGVSSATVRRDFDQIAEQQLAVRTRGGLTATSVSYDLPLRYKSARAAEEKQRIAAAAAAMVAPGSVVGLNGGTTTTEVARALAMRVDFERTAGTYGLTIVTNALNIASELVLRPHIQVVLTGGTARPQSYELVGPVAETMLAGVALDVAILGADGLHTDHGVSTSHEGEAKVNQIMAGRATRVLVVANGAKLGQRAFSRICPITDVDTVVTDESAPADEVRRFTELGLGVLRV
ncbi:MAG: DeoR/GlpR family DNA-binding transcription regulator [Kineosporiaceae bacterium]